MIHDSPPAIRALLQKLGMSFKKRWGQNVLINPRARERIVGLLDLIEGCRVWEIGPGLGAMTEMVLRDAGVREVVAFEVDWKLVRYLGETLEKERLRIVAGDFVRTWPAEASGAGLPDRLLGNLPYASASGMLVSLIERNAVPPRSVVTVQKELAERMLARPGSGSYSSFSVLCGATLRVSARGDLSPGSFYPPPGVVSTILVLEPAEEPPADRALAALSLTARNLFSSRRKTIRNNILQARWGPGLDADRVEAACRKVGFDLGDRAERYTPADYLRLARELAGLGELKS